MPVAFVQNLSPDLLHKYVFLSEYLMSFLAMQRPMSRTTRRWIPQSSRPRCSAFETVVCTASCNTGSCVAEEASQYHLNSPRSSAADALRAHAPVQVRRLYDIANVLSSLRLLDKTQLPDSRKPAFRWRGCPAPGEVSAALAAGAGGARTPNDHLRALIDGAASEASHGADTGSPASVRVCTCVLQCVLRRRTVSSITGAMQTPGHPCIAQARACKPHVCHVADLGECSGQVHVIAQAEYHGIGTCYTNERDLCTCIMFVQLLIVLVA